MLKKTIAEYEKEGYVIGDNYIKIPPQPDPTPNFRPPSYNVNSKNTSPKKRDFFMKLTYPCVVHYEDDGYWAEFPDFKPCYADGDNLEEVLESADQTLKIAVDDFLQDNEDLPKRTDITKIKCDGSSFTTYVSIFVDL